MKLFSISLLLIFGLKVSSQELIKLELQTIKVSKNNYATVEAITNHGIFSYHIDNTGDVEISGALQTVFNKLSSLKDVSATLIFSPGVYYLDEPVELKIANVKLVGHGHGGIDIHGANLAGGTIF